MTRQGRALEPGDASFERAIWLGCFELLRRGSPISEIRDWCSTRTESWRAATISALPLSRGEQEDVPDFDPKTLILWRRTCYTAARHGGTDNYERAVYGLLAGDVSSVDKVCETWDDLLFTHYNALLRAQFDNFLIKRGGAEALALAQSSPSFNAVQQHGDPATVGRRLISSLENDDRTRDEAFTTAKVLQGAIIANDLDRHMYQQGLVLSKHANEQKLPSKLIPDYGVPAPDSSDKYFDLADHDGLRVLAHVLIVISTLDRLSGFSKDDDSMGALHVRHRIQEHIIAAYVSFLRLTNLEETIPLYCSKLLGPRLYQTLSRNLIHVVDHEARLHQLSIMRNLKLNVAEFARTQPQIYLDDVKDLQVACGAKGNFKILAPGPATLKYGRLVDVDFFGEDPELLDREDEKIIRSMEWLVLVPGLFVEACTYAIRIYKYFLSK
jgi:nuclear pore complex protein Nup107